MTDPLDPRAVLLTLPTLLPRSTSSPLPHPTDVIAALVHTLHASLDFRLTNQAAPLDTTAPNASATDDRSKDVDDGASETETAVDNEEEGTQGEHALPDGWNSRGEDTYNFEYRHAQSSLTFRVRVGKMGGRVQIDATAEDAAPNSLSIVLVDLVDPSAFPIPSSATGGEGSSGSSSSAPDAPARSIGLKSLEATKAFIERYKREIIAKLLPGLQKEGYTESSSGSGPRNPPPPRSQDDATPSRPTPDPLLDPTSLGVYGRGPHPASVGHRDLDPQGIHPGRLGPLAPGGGDGGGMYMDFNHPLFDSRRRGDPGLQGGPGGMVQPPGARWDPVGPDTGGGPIFPRAGGNPLGGMGVGDERRWGDEMPPPGEFGPDLGGMGGIGGPRRPGGGNGRGGFGGGGFGGMGGRGGGGGGGGGGFGGGFGGGGMYM
ncbi:PI31 proteasome regulator N-terminal-domain-containing protein [Papiliotrema laurentii]|uniref:PI31 proteasome regulator N-terminal-domain-containing protein n=1 Tax=Papiliotrema laurentii TaxID=5418 RepID=A0AAD9FQR4_PAPLA|nr:PI31 proteasome regulator N-terminal-domain-containing protein [Papiliotrema laurentii]